MFRAGKTLKSSTKPRPPLRLYALAVLSVGLLFASGGAQASPNGSVVAWGCTANNAGQCVVEGVPPRITAIAAGFYHSLALMGNGTVLVWGHTSIPPSGLSGVTAIAAGSSHSVALKADGTVVAWGCTSGVAVGQCSVPSGLSGVTAIAAGYYHSLALKGDGTVVAWGCVDVPTGQCSVPSGLSG